MVYQPVSRNSAVGADGKQYNQPKAYVRASTVCRRQDYPASTVKYCSSESLWWRNATSSHKPLQVSLALVNQNKPCKGITNEGIAFLWIALEVSYRKLLRKSAKLHCKEQKVIFMFLEKDVKTSLGQKLKVVITSSFRTLSSLP